LSLDFFENDEQNSLSEQEKQPEQSKESQEEQSVSRIWGEDAIFINQLKECSQPRKKNTWHIYATVFLVSAILLVCLALNFSRIFGKGWLINRLFDEPRVSITIPIQHKPQLEEKYFNEETGKYTPEGIARLVMPSVVSIEIYESGVAFVPSSQGSGIIMTENGYIITNAHVVDNASRGIKVILSDEKEYEAKLIGSDAKTDLAVIKIQAENLTAADFGDSGELKIGEDIIAIGSPAGLYGSLTKGVVSGLDRMIKTEDKNIEMNCIQIDAAINPGNSGGALVNMYGQVVGINSSKMLDDIYDGIGFSISINAAKPILEGLIADGYIKDRVKIGIMFYEISEETAKINDAKAGLFVNEIDESCDIAKSGLMVNDVITHINGTEVREKADVMNIMTGKKPGDEITATVFRMNITGKFTTLEIKFKLMEDKSYLISTDD